MIMYAKKKKNKFNYLQHYNRNNNFLCLSAEAACLLSDSRSSLALLL